MSIYCIIQSGTSYPPRNCKQYGVGCTLLTAESTVLTGATIFQVDIWTRSMARIASCVDPAPNSKN
jgi:hypothetical protein